MPLRLSPRAVEGSRSGPMSPVGPSSSPRAPRSTCGSTVRPGGGSPSHPASATAPGSSSPAGFDAHPDSPRSGLEPRELLELLGELDQLGVRIPDLRVRAGLLQPREGLPRLLE